MKRAWLRAALIAVAMNVLVWIGAGLFPEARQGWGKVALPLFGLLGFTIGRWWALWVTVCFGIIHAVPVYLGLLPGYLSTWAEALWWIFALILLLALTALGVLVRRGIRRLQTGPAR
jgi:hypothetical protein